MVVVREEEEEEEEEEVQHTLSNVCGVYCVRNEGITSRAALPAAVGVSSASSNATRSSSTSADASCVRAFNAASRCARGARGCDIEGVALERYSLPAMPASA